MPIRKKVLLIPVLLDIEKNNIFYLMIISFMKNGMK